MISKKIINDPIYGLVNLHTDLIFDVIQHPFFQRLRRIKQLGLTELVYPGALHTRFHHAIGSMHLMHFALTTLRSKGHEITKEEYESTLLAILLHDVGHGPFSHALEFELLPEVSHEQLSVIIIKYLNKHFNGALSLALKIFTDQYERKFFHQLVSSQLDIDRLDYLNRDSFYTGVSEGTIGADRIINMLEVVDDQLVVEEKGIYSIENFLNARRLMYWQVYFHKTTVSAEKMLIQLVKRAKHLQHAGKEIFITPFLKVFFQKDYSIVDFETNEDLLLAYCSIDDYDLWASIKMWPYSGDEILSLLSNMLLSRKLFKVKLANEPFQKNQLEKIKEKLSQAFPEKNIDLHYLLVSGFMSNSAYISGGETINILTKRGEVLDVATATDLPNIKAMSKIVKKYYLCWPKNVSL